MNEHDLQMPDAVALASANRFERIYLSTYFRLEKFVQYFLKNSEAAKDILQDTYLQLWENLDKITDDEKTLSLLRTYATHRMINVLRKTASDRKHAELFYAHRDLVTTADHPLHLKETLAEYKQALDELPDQQRVIFRLRTEEGLSYQEIAHQLKSTPRTIKYHLSEARRRLRLQFPVDKLALAVLLAEIQRFT